MRILTEAVDDIVTVDDFLAVSENHILEDVNKCCLALQEGDSETLDRWDLEIIMEGNTTCSLFQDRRNYSRTVHSHRRRCQR